MDNLMSQVDVIGREYFYQIIFQTIAIVGSGLQKTDFLPVQTDL